MIRPLFLFAAALGLSTACSDTADLQKSADKVQAQADASIEKTNARADQDVRNAQANADTKIAAIQADFMTLRETYRHQVTTNLVAFDQKVSDLDAQETMANGQAKVDLDTRLAAIRTHRDAFVKDFSSIDHETADTWDATKSRLDAEWADLARRV